MWLFAVARAAPALGSLPSADQDPAAALLYALARDMAQDGVTAPADVLGREYAAACAAGQPLACRPEAWHDEAGDLLLDALGAAAEPLCADGDVVACVASGWALSQVVPGRYRRAEARDPDGAHDRFERACAAGVQRGCTELGHVQRFGIGTYRSWMRAGLTHRAACQAGEPEACRALAQAEHPDAVPLLERAVRLGHAAALSDLADVEEDATERRALYGAACTGGVGDACIAVARAVDPIEATRWIETGCANRGAAACALVAVARLRADPSARERTVADLRALCPRSELACVEAEFLAAGVEPVLGYDGELADEDVDRTLFDLREPAHRCLLEALARDPSTGGRVPVQWRVEADGRVAGVRVDTPDAALAACLGAAWTGARFRAPRGGPVLLARQWPLGHDAEIDVTSRLGPEVGRELARIGDGLRRSSHALDDCFVRHDSPTDPTEVVIDLRAGRDGVLSGAALSAGRISDPAATCVLDVVAGTRLPEPPSVSTPAQVRIRFAQASQEVVASGEAPTPKASVVERELPLRVLVVMAGASEVDGHEAKLGEASFASIREAHEEMAAWLEAHTHGALDVQQEFVVWPTPLVAGGIAEDQEGYRRWNLDPDELPDELYEKVSAGAWESVFVWVPIPAGYPRPALGVTFHSGVAQATFSSGAIPHKSVLMANLPAPPFELPLHELYHQFEIRCADTLGLELPSNHEPMRVGGRVLSPRTWAAPNPAVLDWYDEVLGRWIHPDLWRDLLDPERLSAPADDLARSARPLAADGVEDAERLVDGAVYAPAATTSSAEVPFAIEWDSARPIGRVVAHVSGVPGAPPSARRVAVEGRVAGEWRRLGEVTLEVAATADVRFPPATVDAVRVWALEPAEKGRFACRELEAYAP